MEGQKFDFLTDYSDPGQDVTRFEVSELSQYLKGEQLINVRRTSDRDYGSQRYVVRIRTAVWLIDADVDEGEALFCVTWHREAGRSIRRTG